jgi:hypothetical protein
VPFLAQNSVGFGIVDNVRIPAFSEWSYHEQPILEEARSPARTEIAYEILLCAEPSELTAGMYKLAAIVL